ncbi:nuclear transport factor 2 family protein [Novosphingobium sp. SL115]|uniref:nuclear transport factor 2 family protein n=1 Tax=Novosphingobium sp. SL115 TaxID=2995150 RepID=UPI002273AE04|nr:nuclear transport factor 2 family protein [Novosphingobium sp. SL115]MCY1673052.1 nuclear transport factor 2 family protein [Novosphingobium sp. SL115]
MQCPIEDRLAIQDLMVAYAHAVDSMNDIDAICDVFTEDAVFDLSGIGLAALEGHGGIRNFFTNVFANMAHHAHYLTNFAVTAFDGDTATMRAYVIGMGTGKDGSSVTVNGRYYFNVARTAAGWKATRYTMDFLMPLSGTLENAK